MMQNNGQTTPQTGQAQPALPGQQQAMAELLQQSRETNRNIRSQLRLLQVLVVVLVVLALLTGWFCVQVTTSLQTITQQVGRLDIVQFNSTLQSLEAQLRVLDVDTLNEAIQQLSLQLAQLDMAALNDAIRALGKAADTLNSVADAIGNFRLFG